MIYFFLQLEYFSKKLLCLEFLFLLRDYDMFKNF